MAVLPADLVHEPREWVKRRYNLQRYTRMPRGGHFAAFEEPGLLADVITAFFATIEELDARPVGSRDARVSVQKRPISPA